MFETFHDLNKNRLRQCEILNLIDDFLYERIDI